MFTDKAKGASDTMVKAKNALEARILFVGLLVLVLLSVSFLTWQSISPGPVYFYGISINRLSAVLTLLVSGVGAVTYRFSMRYLDGEPRQQRFLRTLAFTVGSAYLLMLSTNLLLLFVAWSLASIGLHRLLTFYPNRSEALAPARKKFLISRLGDLALIAAIILIWQTWSTLDLHVFLSQATLPERSAEVHAVALLVVIAALTKSAQFPFHSWLPETMESPTPVSALMHAGIINAGAALLLLFAPLIIRDPLALFLLVLVGTLTACLGLLSMWAQTKVKRTLAWSTVSQMGFTMVQFGLGVFPAAALHIVGHGFYKAWSFLRSGGLPPESASVAPAKPQRVLMLAICGTAVSVPALMLASSITGFLPLHSPGELALTAIIALSIGQLWVALLGRGSVHGQSILRRVLGTVVLTGVVSVAAFSLYGGVGAFLAPVLGELPVPTGALAWASAIIPVAAFVTLVVVHALLPVIGKTVFGRAFHVHALHGFYFGVLADRFVSWIWSHFETEHAQNKGAHNA